MLQSENTTSEEGITLFGSKPSEILESFYASGLAARGFAIAGRIVPHTAQVVTGTGENDSLFGGQKLYAATFMRNAQTS
ncbi:MAG: hypothetical protein KUG69_07120 [Marinosulfonomonas sp.]|nr:hypothetical protein [Marinosulfonomonas sp.]